MTEASHPLQLNRIKPTGFKWFLIKVVRDRQFLLLMIPGTLFFLIYSYIPLGGIFLAFTDYIGGDIFKSHWVGLRWFVQFFQSPDMVRIVSNTILINIYNIFFGFIITIFFTLMLNEIKHVFYKRFVQTASYLPYFISTVIIVGLMYNFFSVDGGIINLLLNKLGMESVNFMTSPKWFRTLFVGSNVWQSFGFNSIIFLSAISGINLEMYDAADVDGANRIQKMLRITLPCIYPTIIILLILNLGQIFSSGYEKTILMYSPPTYSTGDVIGSYIFRKGIQGTELSYTTAIGLVSSIINICFLLATNKIAKTFTDISLW